MAWRQFGLLAPDDQLSILDRKVIVHRDGRRIFMALEVVRMPDRYESILTQGPPHSLHGRSLVDQGERLGWPMSARPEVSIRRASSSESTIRGTRQSVPCYQ